MDVSLAAIHEAAQRLDGIVARTPLLSFPEMNSACHTSLHLKCENMQHGGAFKLRGATNAVAMLTEGEARKGVATHSSGNHAQALARAAKSAGIPAYVAMPTTAAQPKVEAVQRFGGQITFCEPTETSRVETAERIIAETGAVFIHPYEDPRVICGQGTVAWEILSDLGSFECLVVPLGGGGLISGCATVVKAQRSGTRVIGVEPSGADEARRSVAAGNRMTVPAPRSIADGLLAPIGERTFSIIRDLVDDVVAVTDEEIVAAMKLLWNVAKLVVEPSGAVAVAALLTGAVRSPHSVAILSGGNIGFPWTIRKGALVAESSTSNASSSAQTSSPN
jgi:threonine dehydratase